MSAIRRKYMLRFIGRIIIFILCLFLCFIKPECFEVLDGTGFFSRFSILHILWGIWVFDIILQMIPVKNKIALGSQKIFAKKFKPVKQKVSRDKLKKHMANISKSAYIVMAIWISLTIFIGILYYFNIINNMIVFMISVAFYVCDLICVLVWCPFRLIMKNKCCTTCRIFNWDHLMMFSPMVFIVGFYSLSLFVLSVLAWLVWELCILIYPQRFTEMTNSALKCSECIDKLCTQYCQKLRPQKKSDK